VTGEAKWTITVEGRGTFPSAPGETILEAAFRAGVMLRSGCRHGACRTCAARVLEGHVSQRSGTALTPELLSQNYVLTCTASAKSDCTLRVRDEDPRVEVLPWTE